MRTFHSLVRRAGPLALLLVLSMGCDEVQQLHTVTYAHDSQFRAQGDEFEINRGSGWEVFYPHGVNLGVGTPGRFPSELFHEREDYDRWFQRIADLNANVIRLYTLHAPMFYQALGEWNEAHPEHPLYIVQGIWLDEPGEYGSPYMSPEATAQMDEEIRFVVDAVHGNKFIPLRFGKAFGVYEHDVSDYVMAWLPGHEMLGHEVALAVEEYAEYTRYDGKYISLEEGEPIEAWVARFLDALVTYEYERYGDQRPMAWSSWPTLDPMVHPDETELFGQDLVNVDFTDYQIDPVFTAGLYASYHVYPFNPEFIIYQPEYLEAVHPETGEVNSYLGYLLDLKAHHKGVPLFITEYGVPSSMGVAHRNPNAWNHGGYTEQEQAQVVGEMFDAIMYSGAAGSVVFEYMEEWFKRTWMTNPTTLPWDRGRLWWDMISPEESFGLVSYYPIDGMSISIDGDPTDWEGLGSPLVEQPAQPAFPSGGNEAGRTITRVLATSDPAFLFLRIDTFGEAVAWEDTVWYIGLSTVNGETGDRLFPDLEVKVPQQMGLESVVVLDPANDSFTLLTDAGYDPTPLLNGVPGSMGAGVPSPNADGQYSLPAYIVNNDAQYVAEAKDFIPEVRYYVPGQLQRGNSAQNNQVHFQLGDGFIEIRLPWQMLWVTDPSSRQVLFDDAGTDGFDSQTTDGIHVAVAVARYDGEALVPVDVAPRQGFKNDTFSAADLPMYTWDMWEEIPWSAGRLKPVYFTIQEKFGGLE